MYLTVMKINVTRQNMLMAPKLGNIFFMQHMIHPDKLLMHFKTICCPILKACHPKTSWKQSYRWFWGTGENKTRAIVSVLLFGSIHYHAQVLSRVFIISFTLSQIWWVSACFWLWHSDTLGREKNSLCLSTEPQTPNKYFYQKQGPSKFRL